MIGCLVQHGRSEQPTPWPGDYRHVHKPQLKEIVAGDFVAAVSESDKILVTHPDDAESHFFKGIAWANLLYAMPNKSRDLDSPSDATVEQGIRKAIQLGVPVQRFLIGQEPWTEVFRKSDQFQWLRDLNKNSVLAGPMVGNVTASSAQIWVRTTKAVEFHVRYRARIENATEKEATVVASARDGRDRTGIATLRNLQPDTVYDYSVQVNGDDSSLASRGAFRTAPREGEGTAFTIAFGGGAAYLPFKERMWQTIHNHRPELLLLLGDNVYIDDPTNENYQRYLYYRRQCQIDFRQLVGSTPVYAIWDDHDFGKNDCFGGPAVDSPPWKIPVWKIFRQNWVNPAYGGGESAPGCWYSFRRGDIEFFMLDGRYYRDPKPADGSDPTMLGSAQLKWLKDELGDSTARVKVLCSPVPFSGGNPDKWTGYPEERDAIFSYVEDQGITGVLLISADRHRSDLLVHRRPNGQRYFEFMSSKLTNHHTHRKANEKDGALFSYNEKCSFGLVRFDSSNGASVGVEYRVVNIDGEQVFRFTTSFD